ncbi:hypothetical protein BDZ88DRAFT_431344 [Geranomyces variabilis]|nr:hypothetical protein BDZ88DRAFT_431344 [Geranomyces variabilis]
MVEGTSGSGGTGAGSAAGVPIKKSRFTVGGSPVVSPNVSSLALAIDNSNAASPVGTPVASAATSGAPAAATMQYEDSTPADAASVLQGSFHPSMQSDAQGGTPTTPASANASNSGEVRKGRFSVNQSSSSGGSAGNNQSSPGSSAASIVNESARQTNSPIEAGRDNEPPLERKPSRFAVQSFPGGAAPPSTTPGPPASGAANTPATASLAQAQSQQQQQQPTPTAGEPRESTLPRSNSDRRGRFEVTTSEKPPLAPATPPLSQQQSSAAVHEVHGAMTATQSQLIETLQGLLESQRAIFADVSAALAQRGLSFEQLGVHVPHEAFAPLPPVHLVPEQQTQSEPSQPQQQQEPLPQQGSGAAGAIPVGGLAWVKRENDVLRKDLEATKAKLSAATAAGAGYPPPPAS